MVRILRRLVARLQLVLAYDHGNQMERRGIHDGGQFVQKRRLERPGFQERERTGVAPYFPLMQDDLVVTEMPELEALNGRNDFAQIAVLAHDHEGQHQQGKIRVDIAQRRTAAFVDENQVIAETPSFQGGAAVLFGQRVFGHGCALLTSKSGRFCCNHL
jgi:hypothetical protein